MTKTIQEQLQERIQKSHEIKNKTISLTQTIQSDMQVSIKDAETDKYLSAEGIKKQIAEDREFYTQRLYSELKLIRNEYLRNAENARQLAQKTIVSSSPKPEDALGNQMFEREFEALKTSIMLGFDENQSMQALERFILTYESEAFYMETVASQFSILANAVLNITNDEQVRHSLKKTLDYVQAKASNPDKEFAKQALEFFQNAEQVEFFPEWDIKTDALRAVLGKENLRYLNRPDAYFAQ